MVYVKKSKSSHLSGLYYLVSWKNYQEEENIWELALAVQYFQRLLKTFYKKHQDKFTATLSLVDLASPIAKRTVKSFQES